MRISHEKTERLAQIMKHEHAPLDVYRLIAEGADIDGKSDGDPLVISALSFYPKNLAVLALLGAGADIEVVDEEGMTPLMHALQRGPEGLAIALLLLSFSSIGAKTDPIGRSLLWYAAPWAPPFLLSALKERQVPVDTFDEDGRSPLMQAASHAHVDGLRWFVLNGASPHTADNEGYTPLMLASSYSVDPKRSLYRQKNPCAQTEAVELLLSIGCSVHAVSSDGMTALLCAAQADAVESARLLIAAGASLYHQQQEGNTALDIATSLGNTHMILVLQFLQSLVGDSL